MPHCSPLIEVKNVTVERDHTQILTNCSWHVMPGENWVIFGPNGAGKTSILNVIQGYLWPTSGITRVFGGTLGDGVDVREMRKAIPVVSESVRRLINDSLTGEEVLITGARAHLNLFTPPTPDELIRANELAHNTGIAPLLAKPFGVMSTGERQRILITRALMTNPRIVILDEPCTGLDLAGREWVLHTIEKISATPNAPSLMLTTHHVEEISEGFTHALFIKKGSIFAAGKMADTFTSENLTRLFDMPLSITSNQGRMAARAI